MKLSDALRAQRSAQSRLRSTFYRGYRRSLIDHDEFNEELKQIRGGLENIVGRISRALENTDVQV